MRLLSALLVAIFGAVFGAVSGLIGAPAQAVSPVPPVSFTAITGESLPLNEWRGQPVLVVNTASRCGFTRQYQDMQALHETYGPRGLVVLAVPSDDFRQELSSDAEVEEFCRMELGVDVPLTRITPVTGANAHPFYRWLRETHGHQPRWNFSKALIGPDGQLLGFWGPRTRPTSRQITRLIEASLRS